MEGVAPSVVKDELNANAARREHLEAQLAATEEALPLLHPEMARIYRTKVTELARALQEPETRSEATEALRGLVDAIVLTPDQASEALQIELRGNLAAMLGATVQTKRSSESDDLSLQVSLVAGARNRRDLPIGGWRHSPQICLHRGSSKTVRRRRRRPAQREGLERAKRTADQKLKHLSAAAEDGLQ